MLRRYLAWLSLSVALGVAALPAHSQDGEEQGEDVEAPVGGGKKLPKVVADRMDNPLRQATTPEQYRNLPFEPQAYWGYEQLGLEAELVHEIRKGLELIFQRDYKGTRSHFEAVEQRWPNTGLSAVANTLVWQAMMLENFDFRYDKQYWVSSEQSRKDLDAALAIAGNEGWEHFLYAGVVGIEAIHTIRHEKYLPALTLAFEAMDHAQKSAEAAPTFVDLKLADGMYNYWRTVVTESSKVLPDFGDHRVEGLEQMREVEAYGVFLGPPATLSLAFSWIEEGEMKRALSSTTRNKRAYPDNVINEMLHGQVLTYVRQYDSALQAFDHILEVEPKNNRVHYWKGVTLFRAGKPAEAEASFRRYLESDYLETHQRSYAQWRLGKALYRQKRYGDAEAAYKEAVKIDGHKGAKAALDQMKEAKKAGRINY